MKLPENIREYFRRQGKIGAAKRYAKLSPERRREIARLAIRARWAKAKARKSSGKGKTKRKRLGGAA
jgi:hypothetical protein